MMDVLISMLFDFPRRARAQDTYDDATTYAARNQWLQAYTALSTTQNLIRKIQEEETRFLLLIIGAIVVLIIGLLIYRARRKTPSPQRITTTPTDAPQPETVKEQPTQTRQAPVQESLVPPDILSYLTADETIERSSHVQDGDLYVTDKRIILKRGLNITEASYRHISSIEYETPGVSGYLVGGISLLARARIAGKTHP